MKIKFLLSIIISLYFFSACNHVEKPFVPPTNLNTALYPGDWDDYVANEWPQFTPNTNTNRSVLIEDYTGHKCIYCPAAADLAHSLHLANPTRVFTTSIHAGPTGIGDFQLIDPPNYPLDFTNPQGVEFSTYFGTNDGGFPGNPRGTINRVNTTGIIFQSPNSWTSVLNTMLSENNLRINMQSHLNYYAETKGAFLHVEVEKLDQSLTNELGIVSYIIEDSLVGDQKMNDNSHNENYIHRDIHRGNLNNLAFGRILENSDLTNGKYYVNYSFVVPNQLDGNYNASNMHILVYVYDRSTWEIYQVIKQKIVN